MGQIAATSKKTFREFVREVSVLFWTVAWPIIWVLIGSFVFTGDTPAHVLPQMRAAVSISMMTFALMIAGMGNFPANIAQDRERGMLLKLKSMPVKPWRDFLGRFLGLLFFSVVAIVAVVAVGYACGARLSVTALKALESIGLICVIVLASAGIGLLIGTFVHNVHGAIMTGVGFSVISSAVSGVMFSYRFLPAPLQTVSRIYPVSSLNSALIYLLAGEEMAGYDPLTVAQTARSIAIAVALFAAGLACYSLFCWRKR